MEVMDRLISNATPLIYLAKADQLEILKTVVQQIIIPQSGNLSKSRSGGKKAIRSLKEDIFKYYL
jgi:predicted nucleic acid-binding protein